MCLTALHGRPHPSPPSHQLAAAAFFAPGSKPPRSDRTTRYDCNEWHRTPLDALHGHPHPFSVPLCVRPTRHRRFPLAFFQTLHGQPHPLCMSYTASFRTRPPTSSLCVYRTISYPIGHFARLATSPLCVHRTISQPPGDRTAGHTPFVCDHLAATGRLHGRHTPHPPWHVPYRLVATCMIARHPPSPYEMSASEWQHLTPHPGHIPFVRAPHHLASFRTLHGRPHPLCTAPSRILPDFARPATSPLCVYHINSQPPE